MNKKRIEKMIPIAMDAINGSGVLDEQRKLHSNYSGYVDSFGPTVRQSGLMHAVAFNEKNENRQLINELLFKVIKECEKETLNAFGRYGNLKELVASVTTSDNWKKKKLESLVLEAAVACKLAMRTFPKTKAADSE